MPPDNEEIIRQTEITRQTDIAGQTDPEGREHTHGYRKMRSAALRPGERQHYSSSGSAWIYSLRGKPDDGIDGSGMRFSAACAREERRYADG